MTANVNLPALYYPASTDPMHDPEQPYSARVVYVNADGSVNLAVWDHLGQGFAARNVTEVQPGEIPAHSDHYWTRQTGVCETRAAYDRRVREQAEANQAAVTEAVQAVAGNGFEDTVPADAPAAEAAPKPKKAAKK